MRIVEQEQGQDLILSEYTKLKESLEINSKIICNHIGTFTQDILISFVSLIEHQMSQYTESKSIQNRLNYFIIECIQNIISHSNKLPNNHQLAYVIVAKTNRGYSVYTSNSLQSKNVPDFADKLDFLLNTSKKSLPEIFMEKIKKHKFDSQGNGGLGLLTVIDKSGKNFKYKFSEMTKNYTLLQLEIKLNTK